MYTLNNTLVSYYKFQKKLSFLIRRDSNPVLKGMRLRGLAHELCTRLKLMPNLSDIFVTRWKLVMAYNSLKILIRLWYHK